MTPGGSRNDAFANSVQHEFRRIMQVQFLQNVAAMSLDRVGANVESRRHFLVCFPLGQKLEDLSLTARKQIIGIRGTFLLENTDVVLRQDTAYLRAEKRLALRNRLNGTDQIGGGRVLQQIASSS